MPKDKSQEKLSLEDELDADLVFDPLVSNSQLSEVPSSQPGRALISQPSDEPSPESESAGPKTPPHFSEAPVTIPPFDVSIFGLF